MICAQCGNSFELLVRVGRPRRLCYECRPTRSRVKQPPKPKTLAEHKENPHCPWCGAYPPPGQDFCNPMHRAEFAKKVQAQADRNKLKNRTGRLGPEPLSYSIQAERRMTTA